MLIELRGCVVRAGLLALAGTLLGAGSAGAQEPLCPCPPPSPPPPVWKGALGGGLSLTGGNTDTKSYNLDFALVRDPNGSSLLSDIPTTLHAGDNTITLITANAEVVQ